MTGTIPCPDCGNYFCGWGDIPRPCPIKREDKLQELVRLTEEFRGYELMEALDNWDGVGWRPRRCYECPDGLILVTPQANSKVPLPTCDRCGEQFIGWREAKLLDEERIDAELLKAFETHDKELEELPRDKLDEWFENLPRWEIE